VSVRSSIIAELELLSKPSAQLAYEESLSNAGHAPTELHCVFCDDLFHPRELVLGGEFSDDEIKDLAHLYGLMVESWGSNHATVGAMLKAPAWRRVIELAKQLHERLDH
jgi:hypothetical protein